MSRFNPTSSRTKLKQLKRILRYLKYAPDERMVYSKGRTNLNIKAFVDARHGKDGQGRAVYRHCIEMNESSAPYKTKQQTTVQSLPQRVNSKPFRM